MPENTTETPGDRIERERWEAAQTTKARALEVLAPLGFIDADDSESPGGVWHPKEGLTFDTTILPPGSIVSAIMERGKQRGRDEVRATMRKALGL